MPSSFDWQSPGRLHGRCLRSVAELQAYFESRRAQEFRSLEALTHDFKRKQRHRVARSGRAVQGEEPREHGTDPRREAAEAESRPWVYDRIELLSMYAALAAAPKASKKAAAGLRTVRLPMPTASGAETNAGLCDNEEGPCLDDESITAEIETRLSRVSGAVANNAATFGKCSAGWTFEEALQANKTHPGAAVSPHQETTPHATSATTSCAENDEHTSECSADCEDAWWGMPTACAAKVDDTVFLESGSLGAEHAEQAEGLEGYGWDLTAAGMGYAHAGSRGLDLDCEDPAYSDAWYSSCEEWTMGHEYAGQCYGYEYTGSEYAWGDTPFFQDGSDMYKISDWSAEHFDVNIGGAVGNEYPAALAAMQE